MLSLRIALLDVEPGTTSFVRMKQLLILIDARRKLTELRPPRQSCRVFEPELKGETKMLWTIFVILMVLWLLGMVSSYTLGGFIHLLLVMAIAVVLIRVIQGRTPV
jgi:hypothetical protein